MKINVQSIRILRNFQNLTYSCYKHLSSMSVIDVKILEESNPIIGVCQLTCTVDKDRNFHISKALIQRAQTKGAKVCLYI
jgi:hypothetical protein